jgi:hypothetical protein
VVELVAPAERLEAEDVLGKTLVVGVAVLAGLAERLRARVQALPVALPLGDVLVAREALVVREGAQADVAVLAVIGPVDVGMRLGERPRARGEEVGARSPSRQEGSQKHPDGRGPSHGGIVAYPWRSAKKMWMPATSVSTIDMGTCTAFH